MTTRATPYQFAVLAALALVSAAGLTACDSRPTPAPTPSASASSTPEARATPTPTPVVPGAIVVNGAGVEVNAIDSTSIVRIPYTTDGVTAAALFSDAIGVEPVVTDIAGDGNGCFGDYRSYDWGGIQFFSPGDVYAPAGQLFNAIVTASATTGGLELATVARQQIGAPTADFVAAVGGELQVDVAGTTFVNFDRQNPGAPASDAWGAVAVAQGGAISRIVAPLHFYGDSC
ncbi:MAG: hypothetical protein ABL886_10295 [Rhodoglobus sp.]